MQNDLFEQDSHENLVPFDGEVYLYRGFYARPEADRLLAVLLKEIPWQVDHVNISGKLIQVPRLISWHGDVSYKYSGVDHEPNPWTDTLLNIKKRLDLELDTQFNSVLLNWYRTGQDSIGMHSDDEPELGKNPTIASVSLGSERVFKLQHKTKNAKLDLPLRHGDLVVMAGSLQDHWKHGIPKEKNMVDSRVNLTFRMTHGLARK